MRSDYCPIANEPCQSMCDTPCSAHRLKPVDVGVINALRSALEQPQQEPKPAATYAGETWCGSVVRLYEDLPLGTDLYAAPVQQQQEPVSVSDAWVAAHGYDKHGVAAWLDKFYTALPRQSEAIEHYEKALKAAFPKGARGVVFDHWNAARKAMEKST